MSQNNKISKTDNANIIDSSNSIKELKKVNFSLESKKTKPYDISKMTGNTTEQNNNRQG